MKNNLFACALAISFGMISCSSSSVQFGEDGEKVLKTLLKTQRYRENVHEFSEIKLLLDVTAEDSLNFLLDVPTVKSIIEEHDRMLNNIQYQISNENDPSYAYEGSSTVEERIDEINLFADAWNGTFENEKFTFKSYYKQIYRLKNLPKDQVIAKVYSVKFKRKQDEEWSTDYLVMSPNLNEMYKGKIDTEQTKRIAKSVNGIEKIHFDYVVDSRNFISTGVD